MPVNIQIPNSNFSFGPQSGLFYTFDFDNQVLNRVEADGTPAGASFFVTRSQIRNPVLELHYDGTFFWTLEELPSNLGMVIKKWRLYPFKTFDFPNVTPTEFRWQDEITLLNRPNIIYKTEAFIVDHRHVTMDGSQVKGSSSIKLSDVSDISIGDILYLGPSDFGGFVGNEEQITVAGINSTTSTVSFLKQGGLENSYTGGDPVDFHTAVWVFNDHSYSGAPDNRGSISRFEYPSKIITTVDGGAKYSKVTAADFDGTKISFVRGFQILTLDLTNPNFDLESSLEANLVNSNKYDLIKVYDLISDLNNNLYYKLQQEETTENLGSGLLTTVDYTPDFNFQTETNLSFVNSTAMRFENTRFAISGASPKNRGFTVFAEVRDQFNFPVLGRSVQFTATQSALGDSGIPGTFSPAIDVTNVSGTARSTYTPSLTATDFLLDIEAEVL